jgi:hemerythrin-like domain-containing protein
VKEDVMDAIQMLMGQHREVDELFEHIEASKDAEERWETFEELADRLAIHATIEERHFYPAVREQQTEEILLESLEEHLSIKRILADMLPLDGAQDAIFDAKLAVLKEQVQEHVQEEERELFPKVKKLLDQEMLDAIAEDMIATQEELLDEGEPRAAIPDETQHPAGI